MKEADIRTDGLTYVVSGQVVYAKPTANGLSVEIWINSRKVQVDLNQGTKPVKIDEELELIFALMGQRNYLRLGVGTKGSSKIHVFQGQRQRHELEPAPRGVYCGCIGWIGFDGAMDMSMTIRTLTIAGDTILAQAGGGIVADSDPAAEYEESMTKIAPLLNAVTGEGL